MGDKENSWSFKLLKRALADSHSHDPYAQYDWASISEEPINLYTYDATTNLWTQSRHQVKMQSKPFAKGSMRECFRMKKLSVFVDHPTWENASPCVAKRYLKSSDSNVHKLMIETDVKVQMLAKRMSELYNAQKPPKKIDFMQVFMIEFFERPGSPCFCVERYLEGDYKKYNSNVGYTDETRNTPQAFSHFTFEKSKGQILVVDVQGVGDLYTDPQIHSIIDDDLGEGNLGISGYALFFHTHRCNIICRHLNLQPFEHYPYPVTVSDLVKQQQQELTKENTRNANKIKTLWKTDFTRLDNRQLIGPDEVLRALEWMKSRISTEHKLRHRFETVMNELDQVLREYKSFKNAMANRSVSAISYHPPNVTRSAIPGLNLSFLRQVNEEHVESHSEIDDELLRMIGKVHCHIARHFLKNDLLFDVPASSAEVSSIAIYHYKKAAEYKDVESALALANLYEDKPSAEWSSLVGTNVSLYQVEGKSLTNAYFYASIAAELNSRVGMLKMGEILINANDNELEAVKEEDKHSRLESSMAWFKKALCHENTSEDLISGSFELTIEQDEIWERIARNLKKLGRYQEAAEAYESAAEAAESNMKGKKAMKYYQEASSLPI